MATKKQRKQGRTKRILQVWDDIETNDPDISTEKLMALTMDMAKCDHDQMMAALRTRAVPSHG
jgi:hypothetical protein